MASNYHIPVDQARLVSGRAQISGAKSTPDEVSIHYLLLTPTLSSTKGTILLIHGFPETGYQFRHVMGPLADAGYRVVVPDYRGAGYSSRPRTGYEKRVMAGDLHALLTDHLGIKGPVHVVGHDIGGMVAHAYAAWFPEATASVAWGECPLPGTEAYDRLKHDPQMWHFTFHWQMDLPEALVAGRERAYVKHFYDRLAFNRACFETKDLDVYEDAFASAGAMRSGFETYRAFHRDAEENRELLKREGKSKVPAMTLNGDKGHFAQFAAGMFEEYYQDWKVETIANSGHWCAEENPADFASKVIKWVRSNTKA